MAKYIDRERLLHRFNIDDMMNVNGTLISLNIARNVISNFPAADVAPVVHGTWLDNEDYMFCSICGIQWNYCDNDTETFNYCPNCGARMEGESDGK